MQTSDGPPPRARPKFIDILTLLVNGLGLLIFLGWMIWGLISLHGGLIGPAGIGVRIAAPAALLLALAVSWRAGREARLVAALCLVAAVVSLYLTEAFLEATIDQGKARQANYDRRSKIEVITDFRKQGIDAYPVMRAKTLLLPNGPSGLSSVLGTDDFLPLASLPNRRVVSCNENGQWLTYDSDRHGFNNPDDVWTGDAPPIVLLGDSFTHGSCVDPKDNIAGQLRNNAGKTLSLGVSGFGPLSMLAALVEYAEPLRPQYVFWLFFEGNDLTDDLPFERQAPILTSYLERPDFRQNLINRSPELELRLKTYLDAQLGEAMARFDNPHEKMLDFLQLFHLRERFGLGLLSIGLADPQDLEEQVGYLRRVLRKGDDITKGWGGHLILVYLPESARYFAAAQNGDLRRRIHEAVLTSVGNLDIPVIDMAAEFQKDGNPARFFVYPGSHYNEAGYGRTAKAIEDYLQATKKAR
jgi:membrane protein implicated in regulation of membrane protease activity